MIVTMAPSTSHRIFPLTLSLHSFFDHYQNQHQTVSQRLVEFSTISESCTGQAERWSRHLLSRSALTSTLGLLDAWRAAGWRRLPRSINHIRQFFARAFEKGAQLRPALWMVNGTALGDPKEPRDLGCCAAKCLLLR